MSESPKGTRLPKKPTTLQPFLSTAKGIRAFVVLAILNTPLAACGDDDPNGTTTGISSGGSTSSTTNGPNDSSSSGEVDTGEDTTMGDDTMETNGDTETGDGDTDSTTSSDTTEGETETTSQSTDTGATGVDTENFDPPSSPKVDQMPKENEVMATFEECYFVSGTTEPVDVIRYRIDGGPWQDINEVVIPEEPEVNEKAYIPGGTTWEFKGATGLGEHEVCWEAVRFGKTSDPVCFTLIRLE